MPELTIDDLYELQAAEQTIAVDGVDYWVDAVEECNGDCGWWDDCIAAVDLLHLDLSFIVKTHISDSGCLIGLQYPPALGG